MKQEAFFLNCGLARRFCLFHPPPAAGSARASILYLHPFAEELNRSRRMAALQARQLAQAGYAVLQMDLYGCGDSDGDFGDATWAQWVSDADAALDWIKQRCLAPLWLWGLRAGSLLAADVLKRRSDVAGLLLWQPQLSGKQALRQFLRIKLAEQMLSGGTNGGDAQLRQRLLQGRSVEIAGYTLSPALGLEMELVELNVPDVPLRIECLVVAPGSESAPAPALATRLAQWGTAGHSARATVVNGAPFWQMAEPKEVPALLEATIQAMAASP